MNNLRWLIAVCCLLLFIGTMTGCGGGGGGGKIDIASTEVTPPTSFLGGPVSVRVEATADKGISSVVAQVIDVQSGVTKSAELSYVGVRYAGSISIPSNSTQFARAYNVVVTVTDNGGGKSSKTTSFQLPAPSGPPDVPF